MHRSLTPTATGGGHDGHDVAGLGVDLGGGGVVPGHVGGPAQQGTGALIGHRRARWQVV
jgi:hypothetical protein